MEVLICLQGLGEVTRPYKLLPQGVMGDIIVPLLIQHPLEGQLLAGE